jgi:ribonuclease HI
MTSITLYFDGCSKGNPGPSGSGALIKNEKDICVWSASEYIGNTTNNVAEYKGLILGLKQIKDLKHFNFTKVFVKGDSMLVINQMNGKYKVNSPHLIQLYNEAKELIEDIDVTFIYISRNENKEADCLANQGVKEHFIKPIFEFY